MGADAFFAPLTALVEYWFERNKGLAIGFATAGQCFQPGPDVHRVPRNSHAAIPVVPGAGQQHPPIQQDFPYPPEEMIEYAPHGFAGLIWISI
ncbi:MAG: hypothetical protein IIA14_09345 [SAR324 cluster bacterium]|nr:hypothetical protein [SAR324 cluster bacterium]